MVNPAGSTPFTMVFSGEHVRPSVEVDRPGHREFADEVAAAQRQFVDTSAGGAEYVPFERSRADDIDGINNNQAARNAAFRDWVGGVAQRLETMGFKPEITFEQSPDDWYVFPAMAWVRLPETHPGFSGALTLYDYDAWRGEDAAAMLVSQAAWARDHS